MLIRGITKCIIDIYNRQALAQAALRSSRAEKRRGSESPREGVALSCSCNYDAWNSSTGRRPIPFYNGIRSVERAPRFLPLERWYSFLIALTCTGSRLRGRASIVFGSFLAGMHGMTNGLSDKTGIPGMTRSRSRYFYCRHSAFSQLLYRIGAWWDGYSTWDFFFRLG